MVHSQIMPLHTLHEAFTRSNPTAASCHLPTGTWQQTVTLQGPLLTGKPHTGVLQCAYSWAQGTAGLEEPPGPQHLFGSRDSLAESISTGFTPRSPGVCMWACSAFSAKIIQACKASPGSSLLQASCSFL